MKFPAISSKRYNSQFVITMTSTKIEIMGNTAESETPTYRINEIINY